MMYNNNLVVIGSGPGERLMYVGDWCANVSEMIAEVYPVWKLESVDHEIIKSIHSHPPYNHEDANSYE